MKKSVFIILSLVVITSCKNDDDAVEELVNRSVFKFTYGNLDNVEDTWIVLRDNESGELIDSKQVQKNTTTIFESNKKITNDRMAVTLFRTGFGGQKYNLTKVYSGIPVGTEWSLGVPRGPEEPDKGTMIEERPIVIDGLSEAFSITVSDAFGKVNFAHGDGPDSQTEYINVYENSDERYLVSVDSGIEPPKYVWLDGESTVNYSQFKNFDKTLEFTFPKTAEFSAAISGYPENSTSVDSYNLYNYDNARPTTKATQKSQLTFGFLNELSYYAIEIGVFPFYYSSRGPAPAAIEYISNAGYGGTNSNDYLYYVREFNHFVSSTRHTVLYYVPKGTAKTHDALTPEITQKYSLDISKLDPFASQYFVKGRSYEQYLRAVFDTSFDIYTPYEESSVIVF